MEPKFTDLCKPVPPVHAPHFPFTPFPGLGQAEQHRGKDKEK